MRRLSSLFLLLLLVLVAAGCGTDDGASSASDADPAAAAPASAPVYAEITVRPDGDVRTDAEAALKKILHTDDPSAKAKELFDKTLKDDHLSWDKDFAPWVGQRAGLFISGFGTDGDSVDGAVVLPTSNADEAERAITSDLDKKKLTKRTYKGVDYVLEAGDDFNGYAVAGDYALIGSEPGIKVAIDTIKGGPSLATTAEHKASRASVKADAGLAFASVDVGRIFDLVAKTSMGGGQADFLRTYFDQLGTRIAIGGQADANAIRFLLSSDGDTFTKQAGGGISEAVAALPGDAWLALGLGDIGATAATGLEQLGKLGADSGFDFDAISKSVEKETGLDLKDDLLSWMGQTTIYARGSSLLTLGAVLSIETKDAAKSRRAVLKIAGLLAKNGLQISSAQIPGYEDVARIKVDALPMPLFLASGKDRVSIGVNADAIAAVADPKEKLGDSATYKQAEQALGGGVKPAFLLDFPTVKRMLEGVAGLGADESYKKAEPYLAAIGTIVAGGSVGAGKATGVLAVGLK